MILCVCLLSAVPVCASFQSQCGLLGLLECLASELKRLDVRKVPGCAQTSLEGDNHTEMKDRLESLADCYRAQSWAEQESDGSN